MPFNNKMFGGFLSGGSWGQTYHEYFYKLSLEVGCIDESIDIIARALSSGIPYMENEKGEKTQDHPLVEFLKKPNKHQNLEEFIKEHVRNLIASGYSYLHPTSDSDGFIRRTDRLDSESRPELKVLNTDCIDYIGKSWFGLVDRRDDFRYNINESEIILNYKDIIPFWDKAQDSNNFRLGVSRLKSRKDEISNIILANKAKGNKIKQSGKFIITPSSRSLQQGFGNQMDMSVNQEKPEYKHRDLLEDQINNTGFAHDKSTIVTKIEMDSKNVMETIQNYSYDDEVKEDNRKVKNTIGIPAELQNMGDDQSKYENRKEAYLELFTLLAIPIANNLTKSIKNYYHPEDPSNLILDFSHHPAFEITENKKQERISQEIETLVGLCEKGFIGKDVLTKKLKDAGIV